MVFKSVLKWGLFIGLCVTNSFVTAKSSELQHAIITLFDNHSSIKSCSSTFANCSIVISEPQATCLAQAGSITITNNSNQVARDIQPSSANANFNANVVVTNACPALLNPQSSCVISFTTNNNSAFTVPDVMVKGTNTNSTFFDLQAITCAPLSTTITATPATFSLTDTNGSSQTVTVTNIGQISALNLASDLSPTTGVTVTNNTCNVPLPAGANCNFTYTSSGNTAQNSNSTISGSNSNAVPIAITIVQATTITATPGSFVLTNTIGDSQVVTVTNTGTVPAENLTSNLSPFTGVNVTNNTCNVPLAPQASCTFTYTSTGDSAQNSNSTISGTNTNSVPISITIQFV